MTNPNDMTPAQRLDLAADPGFTIGSRVVHPDLGEVTVTELTGGHVPTYKGGDMDDHRHVVTHVTVRDTRTGDTAVVDAADLTGLAAPAAADMVGMVTDGR